jgi:hypothetical protein
VGVNPPGKAELRKDTNITAKKEKLKEKTKKEKKK